MRDLKTTMSSIQATLMTSVRLIQGEISGALPQVAGRALINHNIFIFFQINRKFGGKE